MAVIAVYSVKGGVGKTTIAADLAWRSAMVSGYNTLLWDLDAQAGAGYLLGVEEQPRLRAASIFQRDGKPAQLIVPTDYPFLYLLQADDSLRGLPLQLARLGQGRRLATMTSFLRSNFDRIMLDCPAGFNEVSEQVLAAADVLIVPLPASPLSARALDTIRRELSSGNRRHPPILPVLSMYDSRRKLHREVAATIAMDWPMVPQSSVIEQSAVRRAPAGSYSRGSNADRALARLWRAIEAKLVSMNSVHKSVA